ncbi:MAG: DUF2807 domain-containing protein [Prevotellaceae bacterium]|nr:DUF2807 domain-containing protein [Prevotellaceae bacterium]
MKKIIILACALVMSAATFAKSDCKVNAFDKVSVNVPVRVRFVKGDTYSVNVRSTNEQDASALRLNVKDGTLRISSLGSLSDDSNICVTIVSPRLPQLSLGRDVEIK